MTDVREEVVGLAVRRPTHFAALIVLMVVIGAYCMWSGRPEHMFFLVGVLSWSRFLRPPTTVTANGIRRPWRLRRTVSWTDVASVEEPAAGPFGPAVAGFDSAASSRVRLRLTSGRRLLLDDIPQTEAAAVAVLGGKALVPRPALPAPAPRMPTDVERAEDVRRRAGALAADRAALAAEWDQRGPTASK